MTQDSPLAPGTAAAGKGEAAQRPLARAVQDELESLILSGTLGPGERLNEVALARRLGVSRGPVREAARALERFGLVTVIMNRGAFVRALTLDDAMEAYQLTAVLFGFAAMRVAADSSASQALELRGLVDAMDDRAAATDRDGFFDLNLRFHERILAFAGNREIEAVYRAYTKKLLLFRRRSFEPGGNMGRANAEHRRLLEAILASDPELARRCAEDHGRAGRARFLAAIANGEAGAQ
jgi:DNA-binding GntR family transcriptional regulator